MIDEKKLAEIYEGVRSAGRIECFNGEIAHQGEVFELIRLARLGLWVEKALPLITTCADYNSIVEGQESIYLRLDRLREALAALPGKKGE